MKNLYFIGTLLLQCAIIKILWNSDNIAPVLTISFTLFFVGLLLYKDGKKAKRIIELGWGLTYGSLIFLGFLVALGVFIYSIDFSSQF